MAEITWASIADALQYLATERQQWAGIPSIIPGPALKLESRYPYQELNNQTFSAEHQLGLGDEYEIINHWVTLSRGCRVYLVREKATGKIFAHKELLCSGGNLDMHINTIGCLPAWTVKAEVKAMEKLGEMMPNRAMYHCYIITGTFLETSKRSGVTYLFRKLRPTVAIRPSPTGDGMRILAALCLHPIGYYQGSFGGVMVPTDDVIAHLSLMRGDEHRFWKMANQHPPYVPEAAI
jgi:hypothetical protein